MNICALCENKLTDIPDNSNRNSLEHIIPNSIGGKKVISGFICRACNSRTGETWDKALAEQFKPLALLFDIARERGNTPPLKTKTTIGEEVTLLPGGNVKYTKPDVKSENNPDGSKAYHIAANSAEDMKRILRGIKNKFPLLDIEEALSLAKAEYKYLKGDFFFEFRFGGPEQGRSMIKTCLAFAFASGIDWRDCKHATSYLREDNAEACFGYFSSEDLITGRVPGTPLHCISVNADSDTGLILAYAEYFGILRIVACLGDNYKGSHIRNTYAIDPRSGIEIKDVSVSLSFNKEEINNIYTYGFWSGNATKDAFSAVLAPALKKQSSIESRRLVDRAVDNALQKCGAIPGELLNEKHIENIAYLIMKELEPFIRHQLRHLNKPIDDKPDL